MQADSAPTSDDDRPRRTRRIAGALGLCAVALVVKYQAASDLGADEAARALLYISVVEAALWTIAYFVEHRASRCAPLLLIFPAVSWIYVSVPLMLLASGLELFPFADIAVVRSAILESSYMSFLWAALYLAIPGSQSERIRASIERHLAEPGRVTTSGLGRFAWLGVTISALYAYAYVTSGALESGAASRLELMQELESGKLWLIQYAYAAWLIALILSMSYGSRSHLLLRRHKVLITISVAAFLYVYSSLGNRREMVAVIVLAAAVGILRGYARRSALIAAIVVPVGLGVGILRSDATGGLSVGDPAAVADMLGEFVYPHYPLMSAVEQESELAFGATYFSSVQSAVPTFGLWEKPPSLARQFSQEYADGLMGFAYTPLAEGYQNFGALACIAVALLLALVFKLAANATDRHPLPFLLLVAFSLDINRGESVPLFTQFVIFGAMLAAFVRVLSSAEELR